VAGIAAVIALGNIVAASSLRDLLKRELRRAPTWLLLRLTLVPTEIFAFHKELLPELVQSPGKRHITERRRRKHLRAPPAELTSREGKIPLDEAPPYARTKRLPVTGPVLNFSTYGMVTILVLVQLKV
jgi:hypothetical protein